MTKTEIATEFGKYAITGIISFLASLAYTNFRIEPGRNVSLVPLYIEKRESCEVAEEKLKVAYDALGGVDKSPPAKHSYEYYLRNLYELRDRDDETNRHVIFKNAVPPEFVARLEKEQIFKCD